MKGIKNNEKGMAISGILYAILVLFLVLLFGILALLASSKYTFDKLKNDTIIKLNGSSKPGETKEICFKFDYDTGTITGYNFTYPECGTDLVIPESIGNVVVKYIGEGAFMGWEQTGSDKLTSVDFSNAKYLISIADGVKLKTVSLVDEDGKPILDDKGVQKKKTIYSGAFAHNNITEIYFGELPNMIHLGKYMFYDNPVENILDLSGLVEVEEIPDAAFYKNEITKVIFPNSTELKKIGNAAFYGTQITGDVDLSGLTELEEIGAGAFANDDEDENSKINIITVNTDGLDKLEKIGDFAFYNSGLTNFDFKNLTNLNEIGMGAFYLDNITEVDFSNSQKLTTIDKYAFSGNKITKLVLGNNDNLTRIGNLSFSSNQISGTLDFRGLTNLTTIDSGAFFSNNISKIYYNGTNLSDYAFAKNDLTTLKTENIPNVKTLGSSVFMQNSKLTTVDLSFNDELTNISSYTFARCALTSFRLNENVSTIGTEAFANNNLKSVDISYLKPTVITINALAFYNNGMTNLVLPNKYYLAGGGAFNANNLTTNQMFYCTNSSGTVQENCISSYGGQLKEYSLPSTVTSLHSYAFQNVGLNKVTFNGSLTSIPSYAFGGNPINTEIDLTTLPDLTSIGTDAFSGTYTLSIATEKKSSNIQVVDDLIDVIGKEEPEKDTYNILVSDLNLDINIKTYYPTIKSTILSTVKTSAVPINFTGLTKLTTIGSSAFSSAVKSIAGLEDLTALTSIGSYAFRNAYTLSTDIDLSKATSLKTIGNLAFYGAAKNSTTGINVNIPSSVTSIGTQAFRAGKLNKVVIEGGTIGIAAFAESVVDDLTITKNVTSVDKYAFSKNKTTKMTVTNLLKSLDIKLDAFNQSTTGTTIDSLVLPTEITAFGVEAFANNNINTIEINSGTIGEKAFYGNNTQSVTIRNVGSIGKKAFSHDATKTYSKLLSSIDISGSITTIKEEAFANNAATSITFSDLDGLTLMDKAFYKVTSSTSVVPTLILPTGITTINEDAFSDNNFTSVEVNGAVIETHAFYDNSTTTLTVNGGTIKEEAFAHPSDSKKTWLTTVHFSGDITFNKNILYQNNVSTITFDSGMTNLTIPNSTFSYMSAKTDTPKIESLVLPAGLTSLGSYAFTNSKFGTVTINGGAIKGRAFYQDPIDNLVVNGAPTFPTSGVPVSEESTSTYTISSSSTYAPYSAFSTTSVLTLDLSGYTATSIPSFAFQYMNNSATAANALDITIPASVTTLNSYLFNYTKVKQVDLSEATSLTTIGSSAFYNANTSTESEINPKVIFNDKITQIGSSAFYNGYYNFDSLPSTLTSIGDSAFYHNTVESLTLPSGVTTLGSSAFYTPSKLTTIVLNDNLTTIGSSAFYNATKLTSLTLGSKLKTINSSAFYGNKMTSIVIPLSVTSIGSSAFKQSSMLWTSVTIEYDDTVIEQRFNGLWVSIGWPLSLKPLMDPVEFVLGSTGGTFKYVDTYYIATVSKAGTYKIEVWGGNSSQKGGYSVGNITLSTTDKLYIYPGGSATNGGYNGGGVAGFTSNSAQNGAGASDVRINGNTLYDRVIVAGGAGGKGSDSCATGYAGGGTSGLGGTEQGSCGTGSGGGTISAGGIGGLYKGTRGKTGKFGEGASSDNGSYAGGGGGGGWYGGGGGATATWSNGGGGGSGWVYTSANFNSWKTANSTDANKYNLTSKYYLTSAKTVDSSQTGYVTKPVTGDDGYVRITFVA